jgi:hypothetical protein
MISQRPDPTLVSLVREMEEVYIGEQSFIRGIGKGRKDYS